MKKSHPLSILCAAVFSFISLSSQAALIGVLPATSGGADWQAVYDDDRDITWIANANLADTMDFGVTGINANGSMLWDTAIEWIGAMNTANYLGFNDWRLPITPQPDASCGIQTDKGASFPLQGSGSGCTGSELGHLYNIEGVTSTVLGPFSNVQPDGYWSGTEYAPDPDFAWVHGFAGGSQTAHIKDFPLFAWAVHSGDVSAVPVPAAVWLFGSGLVGLIGLARRKKAA